MGCTVSINSGIATQRIKLPPNIRKLFKQLVKETHYTIEDLENHWVEFANLADDHDNENLLNIVFSKHKLARKLINMIIQRNGLDPSKILKRKEVEQIDEEKEQENEKADLEEMFLLVMRVLSVLRKGGITEQLEWYFQIFDKDDSGTLEPDEVMTMIKVLMENNPSKKQQYSNHLTAMADLATNDGAIGKLVEEIFHEADDNGDGVLSLREVLTHSKFITKKLLMRNTSWLVRTNRIRRKLQPESTFGDGI